MELKWKDLIFQKFSSLHGKATAMTSFVRPQHAQFSWGNILYSCLLRDDLGDFGSKIIENEIEVFIILAWKNYTFLNVLPFYLLLPSGPQISFELPHHLHISPPLCLQVSSVIKDKYNPYTFPNSFPLSVLLFSWQMVTNILFHCDAHWGLDISSGRIWEYSSQCSPHICTYFFSNTAHIVFLYDIML